jgi:hypothetical protein
VCETWRGDNVSLQGTHFVPSSSPNAFVPTRQDHMHTVSSLRGEGLHVEHLESTQRIE